MKYLSQKNDPSVIKPLFNDNKNNDGDDNEDGKCKRIKSFRRKIKFALAFASGSPLSHRSKKTRHSDDEKR